MKMIRETFRYVKRVGYVLSAREVTRARYFVERKMMIILSYSWLILDGRNKGQINMKSENDKKKTL